MVLNNRDPPVTLVVVLRDLRWSVLAHFNFTMAQDKHRPDPPKTPARSAQTAASNAFDDVGQVISKRHCELKSWYDTCQSFGSSESTLSTA